MFSKSRYLAAVVSFMLAMITIPAISHADTRTYSLDGVLGRHPYANYITLNWTGIEHQFSSIDSVTIHFTGSSYLYVCNTTEKHYEVFVDLLAFPDYTNRSKYICVGATASDLYENATFDASDTFGMHEFPTGDFFNALRDNPFTYHCYMQTYSGTMNCYGYYELTSATMTVNGTFAPEPSSIIALICGIGGMGGIMWRKKIA